ncbi:hypothetical protein B0H10DRAFT_1939291 [Mycena sp. CBHHK59/15]|nr:hypothetical protein B0H10DRAFT_1939291 [Mycena sp. CBHHK59/15]
MFDGETNLDRFNNLTHEVDACWNLSDDRHRDERCGKSKRPGSNHTDSQDNDKEEENASENTKSNKDYLAPARRNRAFLPQEEYDHLQSEGHYFNCKLKGHLSRDCPREEDDEPPIEASAAHFAGIDVYGSNENPSLDEAKDVENRTVELQDYSTDDGDCLESSLDEYEDYLDSSDEYYVRAMRIME